MICGTKKDMPIKQTKKKEFDVIINEAGGTSPPAVGSEAGGKPSAHRADARDVKEQEAWVLVPDLPCALRASVSSCRY